MRSLQATTKCPTLPEPEDQPVETTGAPPPPPNATETETSTDVQYTDQPSPSPPIEEHCTHVSVLGDATYCLSGSICSGSSADSTGFGQCPTLGSIAVADCHEGLPSYSPSQRLCRAPVDAQCVPIDTGVWGCVYQSSRRSEELRAVSELAVTDDDHTTNAVPLSGVGVGAVAAACSLTMAVLLVVARRQPRRRRRHHRRSAQPNGAGPASPHALAQ